MFFFNKADEGLPGEEFFLFVFTEDNEAMKQ